MAGERGGGGARRAAERERLPYGRRQCFGRLDRPAMQPRPARPYEYAEWRYVKPGIDYHVEVERRFYSVPHTLAGQRLEARITATGADRAGRRLVVVLHGPGCAEPIERRRSFTVPRRSSP